MIKTLSTYFLRAPRVLAVLGAFLASTELRAQTYHNMAASNFSEDFADIANTTIWATPIKSGGSWSGFVATATVGTTAVMPDPTKTTTNSSVFSSNTSSGGIHRGSGSLVFLATGGDNIQATALDLLLNFNGRTAGTLSFNAATVLNGTPTAIARAGMLRVYYSTDSSTWTELSGTNLPYSAFNDGVAASGAVSVTLPSALNEQSAAKLRFYYHAPGITAGATGNRPKISIDNISVSSTPAVAGLPEITSALTASATAGESFTYTITANGSPSSFAAPTLPAGLTINTVTGEISGTPTMAGTQNVTISAINGVGTGSAVLVLTINVNPNAPIVSDGATTATVGEPFSYQISATNSPSSYSAGTLPNGLSLDATTGLISGTPTVGGTFNNIAIIATNSFGSDSGVLNIVIASAPILTGSFSGSCYVGQSFAYSITALQNPSFYNAQEIFDGAVPGLTYDGARDISGIPTTAGTYTFTIVAQNSLGADTRTFTLKVIEPADQAAIPLTVVINKFVNATPDRVELLVVGNGVAGSTVDMRGMIIKDFSSTLGGDAGGKYEFSTSSLWSAVPAGTLIVLSATTTGTEELAPFVLKVNLGNPAYFTSLATQNFDIATDEMVMIKPAGYGALGVAGGIHAFGSTVPATLPADTHGQWKAFTGNKLGATASTGTNIGAIATNLTSTLSDFVGTGATGGVALASLNFGSANNGTNLTYIESLRVAPHTSLQTWRFEKFGVYEDTGSVLAGDNEDFDGDGLFNLLEYAFGTDPTVAGASPVVTARDGNFLTLTFPVITDEALTYTVLGTSDLTNTFIEATGTSETVGGVTTYTDNVDLSAPGVRRFLRVEVIYTE